VTDRPVRNIGFIGLGVMGREMARNLLNCGFCVKVFDVNPQAMAVLVAQGALGVAAIKEMADVDIIISMLPDTPQVEEVVLGVGGVRDHPPLGNLYIDMSSISPHVSAALAQSLAEKAVVMLDAPVSGGAAGAKSASLSIMVGGDAQGFKYALPVLQAMGTTIHHVGSSGAGQSMKLCNQLVCALNIEAICEAIVLARAHNLDLQQMREVLLGGSAASWMLDNLGEAMIAGETSGQGFTPRAGGSASEKYTPACNLSCHFSLSPSPAIWRGGQWQSSLVQGL